MWNRNIKSYFFELPLNLAQYNAIGNILALCFKKKWMEFLQCAQIMLAIMGPGIEYKSCKIMLQLFKILFRPHLEYCVQFWSPHYQKGVEDLERVQRSFARMLPGLEDVDCEERWNKLGLH